MEEENAANNKGKILLVEDDFVNGKIVSRLLEMDEIPIVWVRNGKEAIDFYLQNKDEILMVFMDLQMPILDGYQATVSLRENGFERPIIAMTANAFSNDTKRSSEVGMDDFLLKPVSKIDLLTMVDKWMKKDRSK
ncbi:response regulator [Labilibaculum sp.]|uniref:response regulator n=1 Tax=Labilibaculum sp. TaxID=2060723 RepID=UPI003568309C